MHHLRRSIARGAAGLVVALVVYWASALSAHAQTDTLRVLDVPYMAQSEDLCGGAAAAMVLRYWGARGIYAEDFEPYVTRSAGGIRTGDLVAALDSLGWQAHPLPGTHAEVRSHLSRGRPVIALIEVRPERFHYVVLVAWSDHGVLLHDPADAPDRVLSTEAFERAWAPAEHWALLVLPHGSTPNEALTEMSSDRATPSEACADQLEAAVSHAQAGDLNAAGTSLAEARAQCPDNPIVLRELAGLRFRQHRLTEAAMLAEQALAHAPNDPYTLRLLASSRYLLGDEAGALRAWNHLGEPAIDLVQVRGLERTRHGVVTSLMGLKPGERLTASALGRARRRLVLLPAASASEVHVRPLPDRTVEVEATVVERARFIGGWLGVGELAMQAFRRRLQFSVTGVTGGGERFQASWRWQARRPRIEAELAVPGLFGWPGQMAARGLWERQTYHLAALAATPRFVEERRRGELQATDWATPWLRWTTGAALDRWTERGIFAAGSGAVLIHQPGHPLQVRGQVEGWAPLEDGRAFATMLVAARWKADPLSQRLGGTVLAGFEAASGEAPFALWSGAGTGQGRAPLLRAHPLLDGGVLQGGVFGRMLAYGSVEGRYWLFSLGPFRAGAAAFVDAARAWHILNPKDVLPVHVDTGGGGRIALPGGYGQLRLDLAAGLRDGATALSIGWQQD